MNEYDIYAKLPSGAQHLQQSGVMANSPYEAVRSYMKQEGLKGPASQFTAKRACINGEPYASIPAWR